MDRSGFECERLIVFKVYDPFIILFWSKKELFKLFHYVTIYTL